MLLASNMTCRDGNFFLASNTTRRRGLLRRSIWSTGFVAFGSRFLELLEIGLVDFDIRSSVCFLLFVCGLGWAGGHRNIVWQALAGVQSRRCWLVLWCRSVYGFLVVFSEVGDSSQHPVRYRNSFWILNDVVGCGFGVLVIGFVLLWFLRCIRGLWFVNNIFRIFKHFRASGSF